MNFIIFDWIRNSVGDFNYSRAVEAIGPGGLLDACKQMKLIIDNSIDNLNACR
jgi:hypothetical protein